MRNLLVVASLVSVFAAAHVLAEPPDRKALPDGGSIVTSKGAAPGDGGGPWVLVDTAQVNDWVASLHCTSYQGSPNVHYLFSTDGTIATPADSLLIADHTFDIPVSQGNTEKYRYLSFLGQDGGAPYCLVLKNPK